MRTHADVLVVGAGPVGLLLAAELSRDGVDVLLIDRLATRSFFSKALGVTSRTLEIFDDLGIAHDAIDVGVWLRGIASFADGAPGPAMDIPADLPFGILSLAQFDTERVLEACLHRHGGAVSYGWTLTGFTEQTDGVRAQVTGPHGETQTIECRWLVGCDGAHSRVRATLGLDFEGGQYPQSFLLADLEVEWDLPRGRMYRFSRGAPGQPDSASLVAIPVHGSPRRYRLSSVLPDGASSPGAEVAPTLEQVTATMASLWPHGTVLSSLRWSSVYRVSHRIVPAYSRGRVLLAGDAAHIAARA
jgi:2-polyprenyl-6-methoxyphenol hydroxylase-like FAD-dependent oxidoreductase